MAASAAFALKPGVWFRRGRLLIVSPDSLGTACPLSGRNSTYRPVQISETSSDLGADWLDRLELMIVIEDQFADVEMTDDAVHQIDVVGDLIRHIESVGNERRQRRIVQTPVQ